MPRTTATNRPAKTKAGAKRRHLPGGVTGAELLARARKGDFGRGIDWAAVSLAYASRRKRPRGG